MAEGNSDEEESEVPSGWDKSYEITEDEDSDHWTATLLPSWGKQRDSETIFERHTGDYLIIRPEKISENREFSITAPIELASWGREEKRSYLGNVFQGIAMGGVNKIDIEYPSDWSERDREEIDAILFGAAQQAGEFDRKEKEFRISREVDFDPFVSLIFNFLGQYFIPTLRDCAPPDQVDSIRLDEDRIDTRWALLSRSSGQTFFDLEREEYPKEFAKLYAGKFLEEAVDESLTAIQKIDGYEPTDDIMEDFCTDLFYLFDGQDNEFEETNFDIPQYDSHITDISDKSHNLNIGASDFTLQSRIYRERMKIIDYLRTKYLNRLEKQGNPEAAILIGELLSTSERLIDIPRTITVVGLAASQLSEVYSDKE